MNTRLASVFAAASALALTLIAGGSRAQTGDVPVRDKGDQTLIERDKQGELTTRDDIAGFGRQRQWAFSSDASLQVQRTTLSDSDGAITTVSIAPAADYFVKKNLSVGGSIAIYYSKAGDASGSRFTIGPRVGYNFEVSRLLSVWPKLGINYAHTGGDSPVLANNTASAIGNNDNNAIALLLFAPVMIHPAPHFFAGLGPFLETDLSGDNRATSWGIRLTMGGWINPRKTSTSATPL